MIQYLFCLFIKIQRFRKAGHYVILPGSEKKKDIMSESPADLIL